MRLEPQRVGDGFGQRHNALLAALAQNAQALPAGVDVVDGEVEHFRGPYPRAAHNKFREGSAYATAFDVLAAAGGKGIERSKLVEEVARLTGKSIKKSYFDVTVVASSRQDGRSHRCIARAADSYYVDRTAGGWLKLVVRDRI